MNKLHKINEMMRLENSSKQIVLHYSVPEVLSA